MQCYHRDRHQHTYCRMPVYHDTQQHHRNRRRSICRHSSSKNNYSARFSPNNRRQGFRHLWQPLLHFFPHNSHIYWWIFIQRLLCYRLHLSRHHSTSYPRVWGFQRRGEQYSCSGAMLLLFHLYRKFMAQLFFQYHRADRLSDCHQFWFLGHIFKQRHFILQNTWQQ